MPEVFDLGEFRRKGGQGLVAQMGTEYVEVINVSSAGMRLARPKTGLPLRHVEFRVIPCSKSGLDFYRATPISGHIVGEGPDHIRIAFSSVTRALANLIGTYEGRREPVCGMAPGQPVRVHDVAVPASAG